MLRKISLAFVAAAALGAAALAPTSASAWGHGFHGRYHGGFGHRGFAWGHRGFVSGGGPGWCYFHPHRCV